MGFIAMEDTIDLHESKKSEFEDNPDLVFLKTENGEDEESSQNGAKDDGSSNIWNLTKFPEGYFEQNKDILSKRDNPVETLSEAYEKAKVKPYVDFNDFNNDADAPYENKPKIGFEVGLKFSF
jgi:hypothetical protein